MDEDTKETLVNNILIPNYTLISRGLVIKFDQRAIDEIENTRKGHQAIKMEELLTPFTI